MKLESRHILLGVSGGIAAYKACELCRRLREAGADVRVVMTAAAEHFVTATSLQALSGNPVRTSLWDEAAEAAMGHIELARWADAILIAPASADLLARLAHGLADDLLTTLCLASRVPLAVAPAMNQAMWAHPATQANLAVLCGRGVRVLGPASGDQACGDNGPGRMFEATQLVEALAEDGGAQPSWAGRKVVVSAGPTFEDIDPVRFLGNRSSGRMGFAVAAAAVERGADVVLVAGPVAQADPPGIARRIDVRSARQMHAAMLEQAAGADIVIAAAAVADYRPQQAADSKLTKTGAGLRLELVENPDILAELGRLAERPFLVGFAAETGELEDRARGKLERKRIDMIAANRVGVTLGFDRCDNALSVYWPGGGAELASQPKVQLARELLALIDQRYRLATGQAA